MFTGLIEGIGTVERVAPGAMTDVWVDAPFAASDAVLGESISCDGVCLTAVEFRGTSFRAQAAPETLRRSTLGGWRAGTRINVEKATRAGARLGGHLVQGHVDAVANIEQVGSDGGAWAMAIALPSALAPFFVEKGSVCIDGVSLTVTFVDARRFGVMLVPETVARTTLATKRVGDQVNLEADIIGKYVARMMGLRGGLTREQLQAAGFD